MRIGLMSAMREEAHLLRSDMRSIVEESAGGRHYHAGQLYGMDTVLSFSRWGKVAAASTATVLIHRFSVDLVVFVGVAGGAASTLSIGDIVMAESLVQHDLDARPLFRRHEVPLLGVDRFLTHPRILASGMKAASTFLSFDVCHRDLAASLCRFGIRRPKAVSGLVGSGDQFIANQHQLKELATSLPGLLCVEMEGAAVAQVCHEHSLPCLVIRVISDKADHNAKVDFERFVSEVACHYSRGIVRYLFEELLATKQ